MRNVLRLRHEFVLQLSLHEKGCLQDGIRAVHQASRRREDSLCEAWKNACISIQHVYHLINKTSANASGIKYVWLRSVSKRRPIIRFTTS